MTSTRRGWFHLVSGAGIGRIFGFACNLLLSRWLGPSDLGLFNIVTTTVQTCDTLVRCGGDYALNFELGGHPEAMKTERGVFLTRGFVQICSYTTAILCISVGIWVWFGQGLFPNSFVSNHRLVTTGLLLLMIACEGCSASAWEVLLVSHRTAQLALRQGLFVPLRLLLAAVGSLSGGVLGAMGGWSLIAFIQCLWLKRALGSLWNPITICRPFSASVRQLLSRGLPFYASNLLSSMIFYPLLLVVASGNEIAEVGYLRVGQILQQLFAFLPATLVPVLFLKLRSESSFSSQVVAIEKPLRVAWFVLLQVLFLYYLFDRHIVSLLFGPSFIPAILPTRVLLIISLFECLAQLVVQPLLAAGKTRMYCFYQNGAAILAAVLGWFWIPLAGLAAYLIVRLVYVLFPLLGFGIPVVKQLSEPHKLIPLSIATVVLFFLSLVEILSGNVYASMSPFFAILFLLVAFTQHKDLRFLRQSVMQRIV